MSLARALYGLYGAPVLWNYFADDRVIIRYEFGNVERQCNGIIRAVRVEMSEDEMGTTVKRTMAQLIIGRDEASIMGGIDDPQIKATFRIEDAEGQISEWNVASGSDGTAIEAQSSAFTVINIQHSRGANRALRGYRG